MTRLEWKMKKIHLPFNIEYFYPFFRFIYVTLIVIVAAVYLNSKFKPFEYLDKIAVAKELERQEQFIKESQEKELAEQKYIIEQINLKKKYEEEEKNRLAHAAEIRECAKKYHIGDRIKVYDMNAPMVLEGDHYRFSIGDIDTIVNIVDTTLYCESGNNYYFNEQIDKVLSKREWKDLVYMKLNGELSFAEDNNDAP